MKHWPGIIEFLGHDPHPEPSTLGEHLLGHRRHHGLSRKALAAAFAVDEGTLWRWEIDQRMPECKGHVDAIRRLKLL